MNNESNAVPTSFAFNFNFRAIPTSNERYASALAAMQAGGIPFSTVDKINGKEQAGIIRTAFDAELPVVSVADLAEANPAFVQSIINNLVAETVRKKYVDQYQPIGVITLEDIVAANTPKEREASLPKELLDAFLAFISDVMVQKGMKAGSIATVVELAKGRFTSAVLNKHQKMAEVYPTVLDKLVEYISVSEEHEALFTPVVTVLVNNYTNWVKLQEAKDEELDFSAM